STAESRCRPTAGQSGLSQCAREQSLVLDTRGRSYSLHQSSAWLRQKAADLRRRTRGGNGSNQLSSSEAPTVRLDWMTRRLASASSGFLKMLRWPAAELLAPPAPRLWTAVADGTYQLLQPRSRARQSRSTSSRYMKKDASRTSPSGATSASMSRR